MALPIVCRLSPRSLPRFPSGARLGRFYGATIKDCAVGRCPVRHRRREQAGTLSLGRGYARPLHIIVQLALSASAYALDSADFRHEEGQHDEHPHPAARKDVHRHY